MHDSLISLSADLETLTSDHLVVAHGGCRCASDASGTPPATTPSAGTLDQVPGMPSIYPGATSTVPGPTMSPPGALQSLLQPLQALEQAIQSLEQAIAPMGGAVTQ